MKLKTATLLAMLGVSVQLIFTLVMWINSLLTMGTRSPHWYAGIPVLLFHSSLFVFFLTLFRKQQTGNEDE